MLLRNYGGTVHGSSVIWNPWQLEKGVVLNLTIVVDDDVLKRARIRAIQEDTSVNAVLRNYLTVYAGVDRHRDQACERLLALSQSCDSRRGCVTWSRDDLHER